MPNCTLNYRDAYTHLQFANNKSLNNVRVILGLTEIIGDRDTVAVTAHHGERCAPCGTSHAAAVRSSRAALLGGIENRCEPANRSIPIPRDPQVEAGTRVIERDGFVARGVAENTLGATSSVGVDVAGDPERREQHLHRSPASPFRAATETDVPRGVARLIDHRAVGIEQATEEGGDGLPPVPRRIDQGTSFSAAFTRLRPSASKNRASARRERRSCTVPLACTLTSGDRPPFSSANSPWCRGSMTSRSSAEP